MAPALLLLLSKAIQSLAASLSRAAPLLPLLGSVAAGSCRPASWITPVHKEHVLPAVSCHTVLQLQPQPRRRQQPAGGCQSRSQAVGWGAGAGLTLAALGMCA